VRVAGRHALAAIQSFASNIPREEWPAAFTGTSGMKFHDAERMESLGWPLRPESELFET
jgi:hypothetical protein